MKNFRLTVLAALLAFSASQVAFAQAPATPATGAAAANVPQADSGAVSNAVTTTTTTTTAGISPDAAVVAAPVEGEGTEAAASNLTNTGGEPVLMSLAGLAIAMSAFAFRRKVSA